MNDGLSAKLQEYFDYVLWSSGSYTLTLGRAAIALGLVLLGYLFGWLLSAAIARHMPNRIKKSEASRQQLPRFIFFMVWGLFILWALGFLGLPLTAFNFLGGALALGFGFGAQNIFNNLISGVIIMLSRPYKAGDIVEVNGLAGTVISIGLRSTQVRTYDGINLLVPNSYFLSNTIVNRTNFDRSLRGVIAIGTSYNADSRAVDKLLCSIAAAHPAVITRKGRAPWVIFENFGVSGLEFKLYFWVNTTLSGVAGVACELRHQILAALRENNISIPYPQLDVHFDPPK